MTETRELISSLVQAGFTDQQISALIPIFQDFATKDGVESTSTTLNSKIDSVESDVLRYFEEKLNEQVDKLKIYLTIRAFGIVAALFLAVKIAGRFVSF